MTALVMMNDEGDVFHLFPSDINPPRIDEKILLREDGEVQLWTVYDVVCNLTAKRVELWCYENEESDYPPTLSDEEAEEEPGLSEAERALLGVE